MSQYWYRYRNGTVLPEGDFEDKFPYPKDMDWLMYLKEVCGFKDHRVIADGHERPIGVSIETYFGPETMPVLVMLDLDDQGWMAVICENSFETIVFMRDYCLPFMQCGIYELLATIERFREVLLDADTGMKEAVKYYRRERDRRDHARYASAMRKKAPADQPGPSKIDPAQPIQGCETAGYDPSLTRTE